MVSTRQSSSVANGSENGFSSSSYSLDNNVGVKTRQSNVQMSPHELVPPKQFLDMPMEIFDKIFSYTGYKTVSNLRLVCRQMDKICGSVLNSTFQKLLTQMLHRFQTIKAKMPRRESARRNHPLACESDIIETLHMRLTLLQMSFGKHIERKHCCFFAGEILDEVYRILNYVKVTPKLARPYRVTDELYDLSTMAMEYFKEHIEPRLPEIAYFGTDFFEFPRSLQTDSSNNKSWMLESPPHSDMKAIEYEPPSSADCRSSEPPVAPAQSNIALRKRLKKLKQGMKRYNSQLALVKKELKLYKSKMCEQQKQFHEYTARMDDYEKKNEETSRKFSTLLQELNKCKTELQYWRSKSPLSSLCVSCGKRNGMSPEDFVLFAQYGAASSNACLLDDPQPSTSAVHSVQNRPSTPSPTPTVPPSSNTLFLTLPSSANVEATPAVLPVSETDSNTKVKRIGGSKRKSVSETLTSHSNQATKRRNMLKVRHKRS